MHAATLKTFFDSEGFEYQYHCDEPLGAFVTHEGTRFSLWAPTAQRVILYLHTSGHEGWAYESHDLTPGARGVWTWETQENLHGVYYGYDVTVDGETRFIADPYARACGLNGVRSMVVDLAKTNPPGWEKDRAPKRQAEDIICEIHVKDFSCDPSSGVPEHSRGKYKALTLANTTVGGMGRRPSCLKYLKRQGFTHVELMPVYDYGSVDEAGSGEAFNWGYDPVNYNVPEGSYATDPYHGEVRIRELKEAVQALHQNGLRVIMDVVYNHTYHLERSCLFGAVPWYYYRQNADGSASNGSGCGSELATERSMCAKYILDSVLYWAEEYHIDGFRFDLMGMIDTDLMNRIRQALDAKYGEGEKLIFGEPWSGGRCAPRAGTELAHKGNLHRLHPSIGAFCDNTRDAVKGGLGDPKSRGFASGGDFNAQWLACCVRGWSGGYAMHDFSAPSQTITYLSSHDDWTLWDKLVYGMHGGNRFAQKRADVIRANKLAAAILFCCQGHLFMLSGEDFGRTKLGVRNSYRSSLGVNRLDWKRCSRFRDLTEYYRGLIALRKTLPGLCDKSARAHSRLTEVVSPMRGAAAIRLDNRGAKSRYDELMILVNTADTPCALALPQGEWDILADGESSFLWKKPKSISGEAEAPGISVLLMGRRA
ncbi:MAG: type I pullulanase [Clostridia bacterium]|nr:type I pullulanase [Clostridia bacterium]